MAFESIQIFACDHRKDVKWDLPYIRFGGPESFCMIKTAANKIFDIDVNADEAPKLFWLWNNIDELGCPDVIGYCQYRRFFTSLNQQCPVINIQKCQFNRQFALSPIRQMHLMKAYDADGILHPHFKVISDIVDYAFIWDQIRILSNEDMLPLRCQKLAFDILLQCTPEELKHYMKIAFTIKENYLCNIFTMKTPIFVQFGHTAFTALKQLLNEMTYDERQKLHPYWLAYLLERYTSCWYHALELSGKYKFIKVPLLTVDANKHIKWRNQNA